VTGFAPAAEFNGGEAAGPALAAIFQPLHTQKSKNLKKLKLMTTASLTFPTTGRF
jgi:hypothetical protein